MQNSHRSEKDRLAKALYAKLHPDTAFAPRTRCGLYMAVIPRTLAATFLAGLLAAMFAVMGYKLIGSPTDLSLSTLGSVALNLGHTALGGIIAISTLSFGAISVFTCSMVIIAYSFVFRNWIADNFCQPLEMTGRTPAPKNPGMALLRAEFDPIRHHLRYAMALGAASFFLSMQYLLTRTDNAFWEAYIRDWFSYMTVACVIAFAISFIIKAKPGDTETVQEFRRQVLAAREARA